MITGDPGALQAAADALDAAHRDLSTAAGDVRRHGEQVTAKWTGTTAAAASRVITGLATSTGTGSSVCSSAAVVLRTYASALRSAQDAWSSAAEQSDAAARAAQLAGRAQDTATALDDGPGKQAALDAARTAADHAASQGSTAASALHDAEQAAARANQEAADALGPLLALVATISVPAGGSSASADPAVDASRPQARRAPAHDAGGHDHSWWHDVESWTVDHASTISQVADTAAVVTAFIPGVDVIATPLLSGVAVAAGGVATGHDIAEGDYARAAQDGTSTVLSAVPGMGAPGRFIGTLSRTDEVAAGAEGASDLVETVSRGAVPRSSVLRQGAEDGTVGRNDESPLAPLLEHPDVKPHLDAA